MDFKLMLLGKGSLALKITTYAFYEGKYVNFQSNLEFVGVNLSGKKFRIFFYSSILLKNFLIAGN